MTFNFPESASNGQTYTASNGRVYRYNGLTWVIDSVSTISNISEQFLSINGDGVVTGSSQLTSSFDERYVLSGSITQTTWDNIENKPEGIPSQSTDFIQTNKVQGTGSLYLQPDLNDYRTIEIYNTAPSDIHIRGNASYTFFGDDTNYVKIDNTVNDITINSINNINLVGTGSLNGYSILTSNDTGSLSEFTSSYFTDSSSFDTRISTEKGRVDAILSASSADKDSFAEIVALINSVDTTNDSNFASFYTSSNARIQSLENSTSSFETIGRGIVSGSSQLTSSLDTRYTLSGSSVNINTSSFATTGSNSFSGSQTITGSLIVSAVAVVSGGISVPTGSILSLTSGSSISVDSSGAITGSLTGSVFGIGDVVAFSASLNSRIISGSAPAGTVSGSSQLTSSYDSRYSLSGSVLTSFSSSVDNRLDTLEATIISGSPNYTQVLGNRRTGITSVGTSIVSGSITTTGNPVQIMVTGDANPITTAWCRLQIFRDGNGIGNIIQVENSSNLNVPYCLNVIDTPSAGTYTYSMRTVDTMSGTFDFGEFNGPLLTAVELKSNTQLPSGLISGSSQLTSSYDTRYTLSGSVEPLPSGLISGSSQLTASYDTRYTLSGSVVGGTTPAGTVSGSSQLTSSFDGRYVQTGSFNSLTASFNSFTASGQSVTTGSNSFNGTQIITGSLIITTGSFVGSQILANTSSLYLTSGSNLYVQNNAIVEITGSVNITGSVRIAAGGGFEGGELALAYAPSGSTLTGSAVSIDIYQNRLRIFENGGSFRGSYLNMTSQSSGVASEIVTSTSISSIQTITSASYAALTPVSGTLYIIIG